MRGIRGIIMGNDCIKRCAVDRVGGALSGDCSGLDRSGCPPLDGLCAGSVLRPRILVVIQAGSWPEFVCICVNQQLCRI